MERVFSTLSLFDVVAYLLSGSALVAGIYWGLAGVPDSPPGASVVLGFAVAAYIAGHLIAAIASLGRRSLRAIGDLMQGQRSSFLTRFDLRLSGSEHPWVSRFEAVNPRDAGFFSAETQHLVRQALDPYRRLTGAERGEVARILLQHRGADGRMATMLVGYWTTSYLMTSAWLLTGSFAVMSIWRPHPGHLLIAAAAAAAIGGVFAWRASRFMQYAVTAAALSVAALSSLPGWAAPEAEELGAAAPVAGD